MPENISSTTRLFADDSLVYRVIHSKEDQHKLQEDLTRLEEWESKWLMQFNPDKCEVLRITNKKKPLIRKYRIHGGGLQTVSQSKYLDTTINSDLSWNRHVDNLTKRATISLNFLKRNLRGCPGPVKEKYYKSLVRAIMEYASSAWNPQYSAKHQQVEDGTAQGGKVRERRS